MGKKRKEWKEEMEKNKKGKERRPEGSPRQRKGGREVRSLSLSLSVFFNCQSQGRLLIGPHKYVSCRHVRRTNVIFRWGWLSSKAIRHNLWILGLNSMRIAPFYYYYYYCYRQCSFHTVAPSSPLGWSPREGDRWYISCSIGVGLAVPTAVLSIVVDGSCCSCCCLLASVCWL